MHLCLQLFKMEQLTGVLLMCLWEKKGGSFLPRYFQIFIMKSHLWKVAMGAGRDEYNKKPKWRGKNKVRTQWSFWGAGLRPG